jgi:DNA-binding MarR family transcriptional regulator/predicted transcriptional regulator
MNGKHNILLAEEDIEEGASLSDRMLFYLLKHPFQRLNDLALMAYPVHPSTISRHLAPLEEQGLVEYVRPVISKAPCYYLTTRGIVHVARLVNAVPGKLAHMWQADEKHLLRQLPRLPVFMTLQTFLDDLLIEAPRQLTTPGKPPVSIRWHYIREYRHTWSVRSRRAQERCYVDAALIFSCHTSSTEEGARGYYQMLLFVDPGLVGNNDLALIRERLEGVLRLRESAQRWPHYQAFPPVLALVASAHERDLWISCAREAAAHLRLAPLQGAAAVYSRSSSSPWRLDWHALETPDKPVRLHDLCRPFTLQAVLPGLLPQPAPVGTFVTSEYVSIPRTAVVKGKFTERARQLVTPFPQQPGVQEMYLVSLLLQRRHLELLSLLYAHPLLAVEEMAVLLNMEAETVQRYLSDLARLAYVEKVHTTCGRRWHLSIAGLRLVAQKLHVSLHHLIEKRSDPPVQRGLPYMVRAIQHTAGIYRFIAQLVAAARYQGHEVVWWETGARCSRRYHYQGAWHNLLPDASFEYRMPATRFRAWVEWDEGTMRLHHLTTKFQAYVQYVRARQYLKEGPTLPLLLLMTPHVGQEQRIHRVALATSRAEGLHIRTTTHALLAARGPLAPIWLPLSEDGTSQRQSLIGIQNA